MIFNEMLRCHFLNTICREWKEREMAFTKIKAKTKSLAKIIIEISIVRIILLSNIYLVNAFNLYGGVNDVQTHHSSSNFFAC